ncbi:sporulation protein SsgA [Streptomyces nitrosporeus]|uniref:Sporulation protein SsgA n=1 Tax=Streptomyces nitrosporeus TaxID=28894 RepID=A0A5J6F6J8_9ACTN|nr:plasmid transfer protein TraB [Streptomyces nitrosporeus]QEU71978.1 sporulation protein SsgA [Streptomyces nitrosporeus]
MARKTSKHTSTGPGAEQRHEEQLQGSAGRGDLTGYVLHRAKPHLPPWLTAAGIGVVSLPAHWQWGGSAAAGVGLTLASVALSGATWWAGRTTSSQRRLHSAVTVAAGSAWLTAAALAGPASGPLADLYLMGAPTLALSWNIRMVMRRNPDATGTESVDKGLLEKVGLAKTLLKGAKVEPNRVTVGYQLPPGELVNDDVAKALVRIAGALDVAPNAVRMRPDPESAGRGEIIVVPQDVLKDGSTWPGPSAPGGSIAEPLNVGFYEHGDPLLMWMSGDPAVSRNAMHLLIMGMTGSGKSVSALNALAEILTRRDAIVWGSDPVKVTQTFGPLIGAMDWAALDMASTEAMVSALEAVIPARTAWLAAHGYNQWVPEAAEPRADGSPGVPYLVAWFEEAAKSLREGLDFTGIAQEARSAGVSLVVSMQRASGYQMPTDTRASLGSSWCHGVRDHTDAGFALPEEAIDAGARPEAWKDKKPGYAYLAANGIDQDEWATPTRSHNITADDLTAIVADYAAVRPTIDPVTAKAAAAAAGKLFTDRAARTGHTAPNASLPAPAGGKDLTPVHEDDFDGIDADDFDPEEELPTPAGTLQLANQPATERIAVSPSEAREVMVRLLEQFERDGMETVGPKEFMAYCDQFGRKRGWVSGEIARMVLEGRLAETADTGRYRIVPQLATV